MPFISERSNQLPENAVKMLLKHSVNSSSSLSPSTVGGSVNLPTDTK